MKRARALLLGGVLFATPRLAFADSEHDGSLAYGSRLMVGGGVSFGEGTRPAWADPVTSYRSREYALVARGSQAFSRENPLGSSFALEWKGALLVATETPFPASREASQFGARGALGIAGRAFQIGDRDARLAGVVHAGAEAGIGGEQWWSESVRFAPLAGPRLLAEVSRWFRAELDYAFVPDYVASAPDGMRVNRWEHRVTASFALGSLGLGARYLLSAERTLTPLSELARSRSSAVFVYLEWRVSPE